MTTTSSTGSSSSSTSSIVSALGGGSGIDMGALANNLAVAQFALRSRNLTTKSDTLDKQISAASALKGMLLNISTSLGDRVRQGDLSPQPKIANSAVATATYSGTGTPSGSYSLEVTKLASAQTLTSSISTVGSGTLTLRFGPVVAGTNFVEDLSHPAVDIAVPSGATLADVATAINAANAGVSAYVANTTTGAQLVLKGQEGAANGFILQATETVGDPGLSQLAWEPVSGASTRLISSSGDAAFKIDGLAMTSPTNKVDGAVPGLNLTLTGTNTASPTKITFADLTSAITSTMQDLTSALNEIMSELNKDTDPKTGDLARDSGSRALKRAMATLTTKIVMPNAAAGAPSTLADLGLKTERNGTFAFDAQRLAATMKADPNATTAMFTNGLYGVYSTIDGVVRSASSSSDPGSLGGSITRYTTQKTQITADLSKLSEQQEALRVQLVSRFAATDSRVGASKSTLSFLQNQIDAWNASSR